MKTTICLIFLWAAVSVHDTDPVKTAPAHNEHAKTSEFVLVKQENNISMYTRWIPVDEKRSSRQVKVIFAIDAPAERALTILTDDRSFTTWMGGTREYRRVHTVDSGNWYSYIQFSIPWPLNDQDCIIHYKMTRNSETCKELLLNGEPEYLDEVSGVTRISHMEGSWKLVSTGPDRTLVEYMIFSRQPSSFPRWITDPIIQNNMIRTMTAFREQVNAKR